MSDYGVEEGFLKYVVSFRQNDYYQMMKRFFGRKADNVIRDVKLLVKNNPNVKNEDFYDIYRRYHEKFEFDINQLLRAETNRQIKFMNAVSDLFKEAKTGVNPDAVYLDYGCNDGAFAVAMAKFFKLNPKNVWCYDLIDIPPLVKKAGFNYVKIDLDKYDECMAGLPKSDLVTIINVIHHIPVNIRGLTFQALDRAMNTGSYVMIKEHDCDDSMFNSEYNMFVKEWHKLYAKLNGESDFMGEINFVSMNHAKMYLFSAHCMIVSYIKAEQWDILKSYYALFRKQPHILLAASRNKGKVQLGV